MKKVILLSMFVFLAYAASAQTFHTGIADAHQQSVSINIGTQGTGAEYHYGITNGLSLRAGANILPVDANNVFKISGFHSTSNVNAKFANIHLLADYTPFESLSFLRIVAGAGYFTQASSRITLNPTDKYKYGEIELDPTQVGTLSMDMNWKGYASYVGLGLIHAFPQRKFNVNLDLGTYYMDTPTAKIVASGILEGNTTQTAQLQKNITNYRWYPQMQLNFNFKL